MLTLNNISLFHNNGQLLIKKLPIYPKLAEIVFAIKNSMITIIRSDPSSGVSTGLSGHLNLDRMFNGNIFCAFSTISSVTYEHKYHSLIFNDPNQIGVAYENNINYDNSSPIVYCTYKHLLNKMINCVSNLSRNSHQPNQPNQPIQPIHRYNPWFCNVLVLDDYSLNTKEMDICLALWIHAYNLWQNNENIPMPPKLVICTTLIDNTIIPILPCIPCVLTYNLNFYPIQIKYEEININKYTKLDNEERYYRAAELAIQYHNNGFFGNYLIIAPGKVEIEIIFNAIQRNIGDDIQIIILDDDIDYDRYTYLYKKNDGRKVIICTNETFVSVRADNITIIIDTMTQKKRISNDETLSEEAKWITKNKILERKGLLGRIVPSLYIIMQTMEQFKNLPSSDVHAIKSDDITLEIVKLIDFGLDPRIILDKFVTEDQIDQSLCLLRNLDIIDINYSINKSYYFCIDFPLDIRKAMMVYKLYTMKDTNLFLHLAVLCTISKYGNGIFCWPKKDKDEDIFLYSLLKDDAIREFENNFGGYSDVDTIFNIWIKMCQEINPFYLTKLKNFCNNYHLNFKRFKEIISLLKKCLHICNQQEIYVSSYSDIKNLTNKTINSLGKTFYYLLTITHQEYLTTVPFLLYFIVLTKE